MTDTTLLGWPRVRSAVLGGLFGFIIAVLALLLIPREYQAQGSISLANVDGQLIESSAASAQRLRARSVHDRVAMRLALAPDSDEAKLYSDSVRVTPVRGAESVVELRLRAYSRDRARALFDASVDELRAAHEKLANPEIQRRLASLHAAEAELEAATRARLVAQESANSVKQVPVAERFAETIAFAQLLADRDAQQIKLLELVGRLSEGLAASRTFPTTSVEPPDVPERPAFPRRSAVLALGVTAGLALGLLWAMRRQLPFSP